MTFAQLPAKVRNCQAPAAHIAQVHHGNVAGIQQVQLGLTLDGETGSLLDDPFIELVVLGKGIGGIDRRHDLARQGQVVFAEQIDRYRAVTQ